MFKNPIATQVGQGSQPTMSQPNTLMGDLLGVAELGLGLYAQSQAKEKQAKVNEANEQAFQLGTSRLQEYNERKQQFGVVNAQKWLSTTYLDDSRKLPAVARESYLSTVKEMLGGTPVDLENDADIARAKEQEVTQRKYIEIGAKFAAGSGLDTTNLTQDDLFSLGLRIEGEAYVLNQDVQKLNFGTAQLGAEQAQQRQVTGAAVSVFGKGLDEAARVQWTKLFNTQRTGRYTRVVINPETGIAEPVTITGEAAVEAVQNEVMLWLAEAQTNLPSSMRAAVREAGGDPSLLTQADIDSYSSTLGLYQKYVTGETIGKMNEQQFTSTMNLATNQFFRAAPDWAKEMVIAKATGAPMQFQFAASRIADATGGISRVSDTSTFLIQKVQDVHARGPATSAIQSANPKVNMQMNNEVIKDALKPELLEQEGTRRAAADMVLRAIQEGTVGNQATRSMANGPDGVINIYREIAHPTKLGGALGLELGDAMRQAAAENGTDIDTVFQGQIAAFSTQVLAPSLGLTGTRFDADARGKDFITVEMKGGQVKFNLKPGFGNRDISPYSPQTQSLQTRNFQANLAKAEADLNTILKAYSKLSGAPADAVAQAAADEWMRILGTASTEVR